jgi:hypothetical protein
MKKYFVLLFVFCGTAVFSQAEKKKTLTTVSEIKNDSCKISLAGKTGGTISLAELKSCKGFQYSDTNNCDYRLKSVELIIKDKMGTDIINQTSPKFLDDMKTAIEKMIPGTRISVEAVIWTDKKNSGTFVQSMKFVVK